MWPYYTNVYYKYIHGSFNIDNEILILHNINFEKIIIVGFKNQNWYPKLNAPCFWNNYTICTIILNPKMFQRESLWCVFTHIQANVGYKDQNKIMASSLMTNLKGQIYFRNLAQAKNLLALMQLKPKRGAIATNTSPINFSLSQLKYLNIYKTCWCVFTWMCQCNLELKRAKGPSSFCLGNFSSSKNFKYIVKDVNILHLMSSNSGRSNYFLTCTFGGQTYYKRLVGEIKSFWHFICANLTSFKLPFVFNTFVHFPNPWCVL